MTRCGSWCTVTRASGIDLKKNDGIRRTYARRLDRVETRRRRSVLVRSFGPATAYQLAQYRRAVTNEVNTYGN
jgi:hypothetical protein